MHAFEILREKRDPSFQSSEKNLIPHKSFVIHISVELFVFEILANFFDFMALAEWWWSRNSFLTVLLELEWIFAILGYGDFEI